MNKIVFNIADQFDSDNNGGFNLVNFQQEFMTNPAFSRSIFDDWSKSVVGSFVSTLLDQTHLLGEKEVL